MRVGLLESVLAGLADLVAFAGVFVVGGDIADAFVEPHTVVVVADAFEFCGEVGGIVERFEVGVFAFDVAEQRLDPESIDSYWVLCRLNVVVFCLVVVGCCCSVGGFVLVG